MAEHRMNRTLGWFRSTKRLSQCVSEWLGLGVLEAPDAAPYDALFLYDETYWIGRQEGRLHLYLDREEWLLEDSPQNLEMLEKHLWKYASASHYTFGVNGE